MKNYIKILPFFLFSNYVMAISQTLVSNKIEQASNAQFEDRYGYKLSSHKNLMAVSELPKKLIPLSDSVEPDYFENFKAIDDYLGTIYIYDFSQSLKSPIASLKNPDSNIFNNFGESISVSESFLFVGASLDNENGDESGCVFIYQRIDLDSWNFLQKLYPSVSYPYQKFGANLVVQEGILVVGAEGDSTMGPDTGAAYIFEYDNNLKTWYETEKLLPNNTNAKTSFGYSVAIEMNAELNYATIGIGSKLDLTKQFRSGSGSVSFYSKSLDASLNSWEPIDVVSTPKNDEIPSRSDVFTEYGNFGRTISIYKNTVAIGATLGVNAESNEAQPVGVVYLYEYKHDHKAWVLFQTIFAGDGAPLDQFGYSIVLDDSNLIISAPYASTISSEGNLVTSNGAAYVYSRETVESSWTPVTKLIPFDLSSGAMFGNSLSLNDRILNIGSMGSTDSHEIKSGVVYMIDLDSVVKIQDGYVSSEGKVSIASIIILILLLPLIGYSTYKIWNQNKQDKELKSTLKETNNQFQINPINKSNEIPYESPYLKLNSKNSPNHLAKSEDSSHDPLNQELPSTRADENPQTPSDNLRNQIYNAFFNSKLLNKNDSSSQLEYQDYELKPIRSKSPNSKNKSHEEIDGYSVI